MALTPLDFPSIRAYPMHDLNDPKAVKKARLDQRELDKADDAYFAHIMSTGPGRAWMWRRLESLQIFASPFTLDPVGTAHNLGRQDVGRELLANLMRICPTQFTLAMQEANNVRSTRDLVADAQRADAEHLYDPAAGSGLD